MVSRRVKGYELGVGSGLIGTGGGLILYVLGSTGRVLPGATAQIFI